MTKIQSLLNWVTTLGAAKRAKLKSDAEHTLLEMHHTSEVVASSVTELNHQLATEVRYKSALLHIEWKLRELSEKVNTAKHAGKEFAHLSMAFSQWNKRKNSCETTLNQVRHRINAARHSWAIVEKATVQQSTHLQAKLTGVMTSWSKAFRRRSEHLAAQISNERRRVAIAMTKSALLYDGRSISV